MKHPLARSLVLLALACTSSANLSAQTAATTNAPAAPKVTFPAPSPAATLKQRVGLTDIEVAYSRPSMKGRAIFGGIEAYGRVWRTGANNATRLTFSTPVKFQGAALDAGTYDLAAFMRTLRTVGYTGPVGFQGYNIKLEPREALALSMAAWRKFTAAP